MEKSDLNVEHIPIFEGKPHFQKLRNVDVMLQIMQSMKVTGEVQIRLIFVLRESLISQKKIKDSELQRKEQQLRERECMQVRGLPIILRFVFGIGILFVHLKNLVKHGGVKLKKEMLFVVKQISKLRKWNVMLKLITLKMSIKLIDIHMEINGSVFQIQSLQIVIQKDQTLQMVVSPMQLLRLNERSQGETIQLHKHVSWNVSMDITLQIIIQDVSQILEKSLVKIGIMLLILSGEELLMRDMKSVEIQKIDDQRRRILVV